MCNMRNRVVYKKRISAEKMYLTTDIPMGKSTLTFVSILNLFKNVASNLRSSQLQFMSSHIRLVTYAPSNSSLNLAIAKLKHYNIKSKFFDR